MIKTIRNTFRLMTWFVLAVSMLSACQRSGDALDVQSSPIEVGAFTSPLEWQTLFDGVITFHSNRSGTLQIYTLQGSTGEIKALTHDPGGAFEPSWSPDCEFIVFASGRNDPFGFELYTMRRDGSEQTLLLESGSADDWSPAWSPLGDVIAYQTNQTGKLDVCFVSLEGQSYGCIGGNYNNALPAWSPDGSKVLFISDRDGDWEIYVTNVLHGANILQSSEPIQLTYNDVVDMHPQFSPDGQFITFDSKREGNYDIFLMKADGYGEIRLTQGGSDDVTPRWVGNDHIVFASTRSSDWDLYLMRSDGSDIIQLTNTPGLDKWPVWCSGK